MLDSVRSGSEPDERSLVDDGTGDRPHAVDGEQRVGREAHRLTVAALGADESRPGVRELVQATLDLVRGLGLADTITDDTRRRGRILDQWAAVLDRELGRAGARSARARRGLRR